MGFLLTEGQRISLRRNLKQGRALSGSIKAPQKARVRHSQSLAKRLTLVHLILEICAQPGYASSHRGRSLNFEAVVAGREPVKGDFRPIRSTELTACL